MCVVLHMKIKKLAFQSLEWGEYFFPIPGSCEKAAWDAEVYAEFPAHS